MPWQVLNNRHDCAVSIVYTVHTLLHGRLYMHVIMMQTGGGFKQKVHALDLLNQICHQHSRPVRSVISLWWPGGGGGGGGDDVVK